MPQHFSDIASRHEIDGVIVVEASVWLEDNDWILDLAKTNPIIKGFVGNLDLRSSEYQENLERLATNPLFRGIRPRGFLPDKDEEFLKTRIAALVERELSMDLLANLDTLDWIKDIATTFPDLHIIVNHIAGMPATGNPPDPTWLEALGAFANLDKVYFKLSGFMENAEGKPAPSTLKHYQSVFDFFYESFGAKRLIYASNWPVCLKAGTYAQVIDILSAYFEMKTPEAREDFFYRNCLEAYRLNHP